MLFIAVCCLRAAIFACVKKIGSNLLKMLYKKCKKLLIYQ